MTIEEKAKAYDEAIKRAKEINNEQRAQPFDVMTRVFTELRESGDEKIIKEIISIIKSYRENCITEGNHRFNDCIAWLEKQGEQDNNEDEAILHRFSFYSYKDEPNILYLAGLYVNDKYRNKGIGTKILEVADEVAKSLNCHTIRLKTKKDSNAERLYQTHGYNSLAIEGRDKIWLEKQGEHTDKVEPKFHEGDWVVFNNHHDSVYQIEKIENYEYTLRYFLGGSMSLPFSHENMIRAWTLDDAEDGDILATSAGVFIYNGNGGGSCPGSYCGINTLGRFQTGAETHWTGKPVFPATKSQRDTLFAKMKEAGYELSEKTHELKKIEQKPQRIISAEAKEALYDKPAWSEEDDYNLQCIIAKVVSDIQNGNVGRNEELIDWLKSLKPNKDMVEALRTEYEKGKADGIAEMKKHIDIMDKDNIDDFAYQCAYDLSKDWLYENASWDDVQIACKLGAKWYEAHHKVQWSEEDERMIDNIIFELEENQENISGVGYKIDWLKQLKQRIGG